MVLKSGEAARHGSNAVVGYPGAQKLKKKTPGDSSTAVKSMRWRPKVEKVPKCYTRFVSSRTDLAVPSQMLAKHA